MASGTGRRAGSLALVPPVCHVVKDERGSKQVGLASHRVLHFETFHCFSMGECDDLPLQRVLPNTPLAAAHLAGHDGPCIDELSDTRRGLGLRRVKLSVVCTSTACLKAGDVNGILDTKAQPAERSLR